jgi:hypothetical protein
MRRRVLAIVFALALAVLVYAAQAAAAQAKLRVSVTPSTGKQQTSFVVKFRAPNATGASATVRTHYQVSAAGGPEKSCTASTSVAVGATRRGQRVQVKLAPRGAGHLWCAGRFHGQIVEISKVVCRPIPKIACPAIEIAPRTIAHFSFRVKKSTSGPSGGSTAGPTFAGLQGATTLCGPLQPRIVPALRSVTLSWNPATDPRTPTSQIVYEAFYSATPGGENFSEPNWTSPPGATRMTVTAPGFRPAYFVVRARDRAGLEDHNTVERIVTTCAIPFKQTLVF